MYNTNSIILITGKSCSGKTTLMNKIMQSVSHYKYVGIELDLEVNILFPDKNQRLKILKEKGIKHLEGLIMPTIRLSILNKMDCTKNLTYIICGINAKKFFGDIFDVEIECEASEEERKMRANIKGWSDSKFREIDSLYIEDNHEKTKN